MNGGSWSNNDFARGLSLNKVRTRPRNSPSSSSGHSDHVNEAQTSRLSQGNSATYQGSQTSRPYTYQTSSYGASRHASQDLHNYDPTSASDAAYYPGQHSDYTVQSPYSMGHYGQPMPPYGYLSSYTTSYEDQISPFKTKYLSQDPNLPSPSHEYVTQMYSFHTPDEVSPPHQHDPRQSTLQYADQPSNDEDHYYSKEDDYESTPGTDHILESFHEASTPIGSFQMDKKKEEVHEGEASYWRLLGGGKRTSKILKILNDNVTEFSGEVVRRRCAQLMTSTIANKILSMDPAQISEAKEALHLVDNKKLSAWMRDPELFSIRNAVLEKLMAALDLSREYIRRNIQEATREQILQIYAADDLDTTRQMALDFFNLRRKRQPARSHVSRR
ncbi:hypothetical protein CBS101457_000271 [Exobasidium rhododendri]|nr:hypothetical protein CBS101457_000271 [Exobasidium rhododendri]